MKGGSGLVFGGLLAAVLIAAGCRGPGDFGDPELHEVISGLSAADVRGGDLRLDSARAHGIWQMCYEPGLAGVDEPSDGYLVLMPDLTYFEMRVDCCLEAGEEAEAESGSYRVEGKLVVLETTRSDGHVYERRLELVPDAAVVLFDDLHAEPIRRPVLKVGRDLNYGFARVYPPSPQAPARDTRRHW